MPKKLKIISYNIHKSLKNKAIVKNVKKISASGASVICLQEVRSSEDNFIVNEILHELGSAWEAHSFLSPEENSFDYGLCILWKTEALKPLEFKKIRLPILGVNNPVWQFLQIIYHGKPGPHMRGALIGTFSDNDGKKVRISNIHLDWQGRLKHRIKQIKYLKENLDYAEEVHCEIVCGDFNTIGLFTRKRQIKKISAALGEQFTHNPEPGATMAVSRQALDHIFVKGFGMHEHGVYKLKGSDHYPVMATVWDV